MRLQMQGLQSLRQRQGLQRLRQALQWQHLVLLHHADLPLLMPIQMQALAS
jgi:hypothetical protein